ncbi:MAG TPA: 50S ribosomal protein L25 [Patescibacteria group bacterium]|nr:50S ribosomal protein L25 [Patescibacteria group bacterium]
MTNPQLNLKADSRQQIGKAVKTLRTQGKIPAVLYGHEIKPINLILNYSEFEKIFRQAGESTLVDLLIDQKNPVKVLIQDFQTDPVSSRFIHVDFHQVRMDEKLHAKISLKFIGESPAVKENGGILVTNFNFLEVECLPNDLVHEIEVDLSVLKNFSDSVSVSKIKVPAGIQILTKPEEVAVLVQEPRSEAELAELEAKPEAKLPEAVVEKAEGEAPVEGEKPEKAEKESKE